MVGEFKANSEISDTRVNLMKYEFAAIEDIKFKILDTESWLKKTFQLKEICDLEDSCQSKFWSSKYLEPFSSVRL